MDSGPVVTHFATVETLREYDEGEDYEAFYAEIITKDGATVSGYGKTEKEAVIHGLTRLLEKLKI